MLWKVFGGFKLSFWTMPCTAYRVLASHPSAVSPWRLEGGWEETEVPGCAQLLPTRGTACHAYTNRHLLIQWRQKRADETEKAEDGWKRLGWDISQGVLIVRMDLRSSYLAFHQMGKSCRVHRPTAIKGKWCSCYEDLVSLQASE